MAFTTQRFLTDNHANANNITPSSQAIGTIQQAKKTGTGTATLSPGGGFTGANSLLYTVQCDGAGTVGSGATFRWKTSATAVGTWEATGVSATLLSISLNLGIVIQFSAGTLVLSDKFQFWAYAEYGPGNLFQDDRDRYWESGALAEMVSNGGFDTDTTGWTGTDCTLASIAGGEDGNCLELTRTGGTSQYAYQVLTTIVGEKYRIKGYVKSGTSGAETARIQISAVVVASATTSGDWTQISGAFVATATSSTLVLLKNSATAGTMLFDSIECRQLPSILVDLGAADTLTAVALLDHNFSADATVTLAANSSGSWSSPGYSNDILSSSDQDPCVDYFSQTYRYWKLFIDDAWNDDLAVRMSMLYLGTYSELTGSLRNIPWGSKKGREIIRTRNKSDAGKLSGKVYAEHYVFTTQYFPTRGSGDLDVLEALWEATFNTATGQDKAVLIHYFYDEEDTLYLCYCLTDRFDIEYVDYGHYSLSMDWSQLVKTRSN